MPKRDLYLETDWDNETEESCKLDLEHDKIIPTNSGSPYWSSLSIEEQNAYIAEAKKGNEVALCFIISGVSAYVHSKAKHYSLYFTCSSLKDDLYQEGILGIIKAIEKYECDTGVKFLSFAGYYVKAYMFRFMRDKMYQIRIPRYLIDKYFHIKNLLTYERNYLELQTILEEESLKSVEYDLNMTRYGKLYIWNL